jgi:hypothetical protein
MNNFNQLYNKLFYEQLGGVNNIGIFPGAFKPPHMGHYYTALNACRDNDQVYIFVSKKSRALSTQNIAQPAGAKDCDAQRYSNFMSSDKYTGNLMSIRPAECERLTSASAMRAAISVKDKRTIFENIPDNVDKQAVYDILMKSNDLDNPDYGHITIEQTIQIWNMFKQSLAQESGMSSEQIKVIVSDMTPVRDTYELVDTINKSTEADKTNIKLYVGT